MGVNDGLNDQEEGLFMRFPSPCIAGNDRSLRYRVPERSNGGPGDRETVVALDWQA